MMNLLIGEVLLLAYSLAEKVQVGSNESTNEKTMIIMEGDTAILDWAKCCDCEATHVKPVGKPCEVTLTIAQRLKLKFSNSQWMHNVMEVPSKAAFDTCQIPEGKMAIGQSNEAPGVQTLDHTMTYTEAGTFYYVCSIMCLNSTGGPNDQYCHCSGFNHKLIVTVTPVTTATTTTTGVVDKTVITMEGDTAILDWAKCCDCEATHVKPVGKPCEVTLTTAQRLKLKFSNSQWMHNVMEVPSKAAFDTCHIPEGKMAIGQSAEAPGVQTLDHTMTFTEAGTFYYVCSMMCLNSTGGPNDQYCHCSGFNHKLIVTVTVMTTATTTNDAASYGKAMTLTTITKGLLIVATVACLA